jgi:hypothetical protein
MTQISKTAFTNLYGSSGTTFPDNTTGAISEGDVRQFGQDMADSFLSIQDNFIDEDSFATDSATRAPSQQSVKAYVNAQVQVLRSRVQITGGSSTRSIGTSPQTILAAVTGKFYNIISVSVAYDYGSVVYDFGSSANIVTQFSGLSATSWTLDYTIMNQSSNFNYRLVPPNTSAGFNCPVNTAFILTTADSTDATTGDGDIQIIVIYTLEDENT